MGGPQTSYMELRSTPQVIPLITRSDTASTWYSHNLFDCWSPGLRDDYDLSGFSEIRERPLAWKMHCQPKVSHLPHSAPKVVG